MTRQERINLNLFLGLPVDWLEDMTDQEYEAERDFREEKALKSRLEHKIEKKLRKVPFSRLEPLIKGWKIN